MPHSGDLTPIHRDIICGTFPAVTRYSIGEDHSGANVYRRAAITLSLSILLALALVLRPAFFDPVSLLLTIGGALTATFFSYSRKQLQGLMGALGEMIEGHAPSAQACARELGRLTELYRLQGIRGLENQERHLTDSFLRYGVELLVDFNNEDKIRSRLQHRQASLSAAHEINRQILATLGKLLPSFGLIGTLIGIVLMLERLATLDANGLPAALGLAVLTTLYGAVSANVLVAPLLSRLQSTAVEREVSMNLIKEWILMIARGDGANISDQLPGSLAQAEFTLGRVHEWEPIALSAER